jgi:fumarylpyruvate hydrolase
MTRFAFDPVAQPSVEIAGSEQRFPVHRIYCVGRNYAEHVLEMGGMPERDPPFFFSKPPDAVIANGANVPYPPRTANLHHEIELVVAIGRAGRNIPAANALEHVFGYAVGNDFTRRDLQAAAREGGKPWDTSKGFDNSAAISAIHTGKRGQVPQGRIWLSVNGTVRQDSVVSRMTWSVPEIIAELSTFFELKPGDLIYTGTPSGVGPLKAGDRIEGGVEGLDELRNTIVAA